MSLLVNNFKMLGILLNVVQGQVQKSLQKPITKGFPFHFNPRKANNPLKFP